MTGADVEPVGRGDWFRRRAHEVVDRSGWEALNLDPSAIPDRRVAFAAAISAGVAHFHAGGAPFGFILRWTADVLGDDEGGVAYATAAYGHFRAGFGVDGLIWSPTSTYSAMLTWMMSFEAPDLTDEDRSRHLVERWRVPEASARSIVGDARDWVTGCEPSYAADHPQLGGLVSASVIRSAIDARSALIGESLHLRALVEDTVVLRALERDIGTSDPKLKRELEEGLERRLDRLTAMEIELLADPTVERTVIGWAQHRNRMHSVNLLNLPDEGVMAVSNGVCEAIDEQTLVPDWLEKEIFNARTLAGFARFGPTAHVWATISDIDDLSTLELEVDLEPHVNPDSHPPPLALYWRDQTRERTDWTWVSLLVRDHPEAWGWLAVALLTGRIIIDALVVDDNNVVTLVQRTVAVLGDDTIATWGRGFPGPPSHLGAGLQGMAERHVLGGLQAAERSKSFDLLELYDDEAEDVAIQEARRSVLQAEGARAEQLWALAGLDDQGVDDAWRKFRELRAWRHSEVTDTSIDPEAWLRDLAGGLTTSTRAIVHMMVGEGLELFWAVDGGERCDVDVVQAPIKPLLSSLEPWRTGSSLRPTSGRDPIADMLVAAAPIADALAELARREGIGHLIIVPWRGLHSVPWAALTLTDGTALRDHVRITHAPALRMLRSPERRTLGGPAVAIAVHGGTLPFVDREVQLIASIRGASVVPDGTPSGAIVDAMNGASVIHIAGHAEATTYPLAGALLAGQPPLDADRVTSSARIHADARLSGCDLVVLNACNSGRYSPEARSFENHTGFDAACLSVGAKVVISTLWPVVDFPATLVAAALHWYLAEGVPPAEALDNAVGVLRDGLGSEGLPLDLRQTLDVILGAGWRADLDDRVDQLRHPYWWAAWRISGADWLFDDAADQRKS